MSMTLLGGVSDLAHRKRDWVMRLARWTVVLMGMAIALFLTGCQTLSGQLGTTAQVMRVASGQTIEILDPSGQTALNQSVRLIGISAPDLKQEPWGMEAKAYLEAQLQNSSVTLEFDAQPTDGYDRQLAYIWKDGVLLNEALVENGLVLAEVRSPNLKYEQRLKHAQEAARILGRGIWNPEHPMRMTPQEFRQQQPSS